MFKEENVGKYIFRPMDPMLVLFYISFAQLEWLSVGLGPGSLKNPNPFA